MVSICRVFGGAGVHPFIVLYPWLVTISMNRKVDLDGFVYHTFRTNMNQPLAGDIYIHF